jgi:hypothetical protein
MRQILYYLLVPNVISRMLISGTGKEKINREIEA